MTKLEIYIDFEAISAPFNRKIKIKHDFPYAYSLGIFVGKKFKTKTFVFDFNHDNVEYIEEILRKSILDDVRELLDNKWFAINRDSVKFISYGPSLERKILSKVYRGIRVEDISKGMMISLSHATEEYYDKDIEYFTYLKTYLEKNVDKKFFQKRGLAHDGAIAAIVGYYLYLLAHNQEGDFMKDEIDIKTMLKELKKYSVDDVIRMKLITENKEEFYAKAKERESLLRKISNIGSKISNLRKIKKLLEVRDENMTLKDLKEEIDKEIEDFKKEKEELKNNKKGENEKN